MRAVFPGFLLLVFAGVCAAQTPATIHYEALPGAALYEDGYLFSWDSPKYREITFYHRDTQPAWSMAEHGDGIYRIGWASDFDGVVASVYELRPAWQGRIDLLNGSGKQISTINTNSYIPESVVFAPDHTIWTAGYYAGNDGTKGDFNVLHHYARTGQELGEALSWSQIAGDHNTYTALQGILGGRWLYAGDDRLGFVASLNYGFDTWLEVNYAGALLGKYDLAPNPELVYEPAAMTAGGSVYAASYKDDHFDGWAVLNRSQKVWDKVTGYPKGRIIGSDGENLVFSQREGAWTILQFVSPGTLRAEKLQPETAALVSKR